MTANEIAQWVIDNRYSKNELASDFELFTSLVEKINECANDKAKYHCEQQAKAIVKQFYEDKYDSSKSAFDIINNAYNLDNIK